jgi:hypothetical protein
VEVGILPGLGLEWARRQRRPPRPGAAPRGLKPLHYACLLRARTKNHTTQHATARTHAPTLLAHPLMTPRVRAYRGPSPTR